MMFGVLSRAFGSEDTAEKRSQRKDFFHCMLSAAKSSDVIPDVGIDLSLVKYSGLNSAAELENSFNQVLKDKCSKIPGYVQSLCVTLAPFTRVPNAVGLGAVAVSIGLELIIGDQGEDRESKDSMLDMMRRVFAEEKASGVRDSMEECMKRLRMYLHQPTRALEETERLEKQLICVRDSMEEYMKRLRMYLHQPTRALEETERLEKQLSEQLTRLKNSMLHDDQMSSRSLKHWTNGAAFHLQMLIHAARLKTQSSSGHREELQVHVASIESVLDCYQFDLVELLKQYKAYKKLTISLTHPAKWLAVFGGFPMTSISETFWFVQDKELDRETSSIYHPLMVTISTDDYVDYMFDNWDQLKGLKNYFSDVKMNVENLIIQNAEFNLKKFLAVLDEQGA